LILAPLVLAGIAFPNVAISSYLTIVDVLVATSERCGSAHADNGGRLTIVERPLPIGANA
jgi:hypothetical protein